MNKVIKEYYLTDNLKLVINYEKHKECILDALSVYLNKKIYKREEEDETGVGAFWDAANSIVSQELGWMEDAIYSGELEKITPQHIDELVDVVYSDVKVVAKELVDQILPN